MKTLLLSFVALSFAGVQLSAQSADWSSITAALGREGAAQPGGVMKYSFPRTDLDVAVDGIVLKPSFALGSWVAFMREGPNTIAMGDLVLTQDEISTVVSTLQMGSVQITALHNHLLNETPRVMMLHISAVGDGNKIARKIRDALVLTRTPIEARAREVLLPIDLDTAAISLSLGFPGRMNGGVFQISIPRAEKVLEGGMEIPAAMGTATSINFQATGRETAATTGDFVMTDVEVNPVIMALRAGRIKVTALHSHMIGETPRLYFMHFWANDDAVTLARTLCGALRNMNVPGRRLLTCPR